MSRKSNNSLVMSADLQNDLSHLRTAEQANQRALLDMRLLKNLFTDF